MSLRIDVVSIFPDYLAALDLSLIGRAREEGLLDIHVHDLRDFTHDRHRTVDDTPYGGGAGMVMKAQPWAEALAHVLAAAPVPASGASLAPRPHLIVPGPGGERFTQGTARRLAEEPWLAFACGRYEGIDERVYEYAREDLGLEVSVLSLGDYVLNGGEVAVLAMVEAIGRLVPGVVGNAESLVEESHEDGLLEYPIYTKPRTWQGRDVPEVLLSGNHAVIADWRHGQRLARTAARRPDLLHASHVVVEGVAIGDLVPATPADVPELYTLMRACWAQEVLATSDPAGSKTPTPAGLDESVDELRADLARTPMWVIRSSGRLVGAVGTEDRDEVRTIRRLLVAPDLPGPQSLGLERRLLEFAEDSAPMSIKRFRLLLPTSGGDRWRRHRKAGYRVVADAPPGAPVQLGRNRPTGE